MADACLTCEQELARCRAWERKLLADLASVRDIIAGLEESSTAQDTDAPLSLRRDTLTGGRFVGIVGESWQDER
jgi:hypothetical protein